MRAENPKARDDAGRLREFGTAGGVPVVEAAGDLPVKNWTLGSWAEGAKKIAPQTHFARTLEGHYACFGCPIRCGKVIRMTAQDAGHGGPAHNAQTVGHAPEYETAAGFGPLLLNDDLDTIFAANELCNRYGLDTISTAAAIAFAMEAHERCILPSRCHSELVEEPSRGAIPDHGADRGGKVSPSERCFAFAQHDKEEGGDGAKLRWGDGAAILALIHQIARREGIGKLLGDGVRRAAEALGPEAASFAIHTKGLEYPFHDPRAFVSMAPDYATGSRGSCHLESFSYVLGYGSPMPDFGIERGGVEPHEHEGAARTAVLMQNLMAVFDALGMCKFVCRNGTGPSKLAHWLSLATGWNVSADELMAAGERLFNLKRAYNLRCGVRGADDRLPDRFLHLDRKTGGAAGSLPDMARLLPEYYALRGWDKRGFPTPDTLRRLGLDEVAGDLAALQEKIENEDEDDDEDG
jgi:aldehyde:ferredoxin oxidoreductase